ncbi:MAG: hypothetical protein DWI69_14485 [Chloroflexi bacterium]|nr:MAG: hypothetical protein DWI69_14485 [Chloroflexota bacterium]
MGASDQIGSGWRHRIAVTLCVRANTDIGAPGQVGIPGGMARRGPTGAENMNRIGRRRATFQAGNDARG